MRKRAAESTIILNYLTRPMVSFKDIIFTESQGNYGNQSVDEYERKIM